MNIPVLWFGPVSPVLWVVMAMAMVALFGLRFSGGSFRRPWVWSVAVPLAVLLAAGVMSVGQLLTPSWETSAVVSGVDRVYGGRVLDESEVGPDRVFSVDFSGQVRQCSIKVISRDDVSELGVLVCDGTELVRRFS